MRPAIVQLKVRLAVLIAALVVGLAWPAWSQVQVRPGSPDAHASELLNQAIGVYHSGRIVEAETAFRAALVAAEAIGDPAYSEAIAMVLSWQTTIYYQLRRLDEAWRAGERFLAIHEPRVGPDEINSTRIHGFMGAIAFAQAQYDRAEPHLRAVVDAHKRRGGSQQRDATTATAAYTLGRVLQIRGKRDEAVTVLRLSAEVRERAAPWDPVNSARARELLGIVYEEMAQPVEAEAAYKAAVDDAKDLQGPSVSVLVDVLKRLAAFYQNHQRYDEAWSTAQQALERRVAVPGELGQEATVHAALATIASWRGDKQEAESQARWVLSAYDANPGAVGHAAVASATYELAGLLWRKPNLPEAMAMAERAVEHWRKVVPANDSALADAYDRQAWIYRTAERTDAAEAPARGCVEVTERIGQSAGRTSGSCFYLLGIVHFEAGRYFDAEKALQTALAIKSNRKEEPLVISEVEVHLSAAYRYLGRYDGAERFARRALDKREAALKPDHELIADALFNLAAAYRWQNQYAKAEPLLRRSLAIREAALGPDNRHTLADLNALALCLEGIGRASEAEAMLRRVLAGRERVLGANDPDVADTLVSLIYLLRSQGRYAEAMAVAERPLAIYRAALGPSHPTAVRGIRVLATVHQDRAEFAMAEQLFREALKIRQATYGLEHVNVAASYRDLVDLSLQRRQFEEAAAYGGRALAIYEKAYGADDMRIVSTLRSLAALQLMIAEPAVAGDLLKRALAISERVQGNESIAVAILSTDMAMVSKIQGRLGDAEKYYERPLGIYRNLLGPRHPQVAFALNLRAELDIALGQPQEAERRYDEAAEILTAAYGGASPVVSVVLNSRANLLVQLGRLGEAEQLYKRAIDLLRTGAGRDTWALACVLFNLGGVYDASGRPREAERLGKEAVEISNKIFGPDHAPPLVPSAVLPPPSQEI